MTLLRTEDLSMHFYGVKALDGVSISVNAGEIVGVIGPNGSGKSTMFNCITGVLRPTRGKVYFNEQDITGSPPERAFAKGMSRTFQLPHVFDEMTVVENFLLAVQEAKRTLLGRLFRHREDEEHRRAEEVLELLRLGHVAHLPAKSLSYGQKKLCDLGMALMSEPDVIMLDEPMAGVNPALIDEMVEHIRRLNEAGNTFVLVEHNLKVTMNLCPRVIVLDEGHKIAEGTPAEIQANEQVVAAYFGG